MIPTLIYCADGNRHFAEIAINPKKKYGVHQFKYGAQLPRKVYFNPYFADQNYKRPRYVRYIQALAKHQPTLATVLDIMEWRRLDEYLMRAEEISQYCKEVILIPKLVGVIKFLPRTINGKPVRLGYSVDTDYGKTDVPVEEFGDWPIHLLGGSPTKQMKLTRDMNVISCDGNYTQLMTRYNQFFYPEFLWDENYRKKVEADKGKKAKERKIKNPIWPTLLEFDGQKWGDGSSKADAPYEAFRRSCENVWLAWKSAGGLSCGGAD